MAKRNGEHTRITLGLIFSWLFGVMFALSSFGLLVQKSYFSGIIVLFGSLLIIPYFNQLICNKLKIELSSGVKWSIIIVVLIFFFVGISNDDSSAVAPQIDVPTVALDNYSTVKLSKPSTPNKVYLSDTYNNLYLIFGSRSKYTDLQKERIFVEKYKGNYVKWKGEVVDIDNTYGSLTIYLKHRERGEFEFGSSYDVVLYVNPDQQNKLETISKGDMITYSGKLTEISEFLSMTLRIKDGEVIS